MIQDIRTTPFSLHDKKNILPTQNKVANIMISIIYLLWEFFQYHTMGYRGDSGVNNANCLVHSILLTISSSPNVIVDNYLRHFLQKEEDSPMDM